jgi:hypothetical protein
LPLLAMVLGMLAFTELPEANDQRVLADEELRQALVDIFATDDKRRGDKGHEGATPVSSYGSFSQIGSLKICRQSTFGFANRHGRTGFVKRQSKTLL